MITKIKSFIQEYYFVILPILITCLIYSVSLTFGFRNFDEDVIIKDFYTNKTLGEYLEKYLLTNFSGITSAYGSAFSSIRNIHWCPLERPLFYIVNYLFKANPFFFHTLGLILHLSAAIFFILFAYNFTKSKNIALFSGIIWAIHPVNVEPVIWATNWPALLGATLYFFTLNYVTVTIQKEKVNFKHIAFIAAILFLIQILLIEHCISLPIILWAVSYFIFQKTNNSSPASKAFKIFIPSFAIALVYLCIRFFLISNDASTQGGSFVERVLFITPQVLIHHLKLFFFPMQLSIDQLDLLDLDNSFLGIYHISCMVVCLQLITMVSVLRKKFPVLYFGVFCYLMAIAPFLQIIPLYSIAAERYNYFASAFLTVAIVASIENLFKSKKLIFTIIVVTLSIFAGGRSLYRIFDWESSKTLFLSTINSSKSLFKKGIWTYNLALSEDSNEKELLLVSKNLLEVYIQNTNETNNLNILKNYELDSNSLTAKAHLRLAKINKLLGNSQDELLELNKALNLANEKSLIKSEAYKLLATHFFKEGNFNKAIDLYTKSNQLTNDLSTDLALAICYLKLNDFKNYAGYLKKATLEVSSNNIQSFKAYGQFLELNTSDFKEAERMYKIATLLEDDPIPYTLLATLQLKQNKINEAFQTVKRGLYSFPKHLSLIYLNGVISINKGKKEAGKADLERVLRDNTAENNLRVEAGNILVNILLSENNVEKVKEYNKLILEIDPNNTEALSRHLL